MKKVGFCYDDVFLKHEPTGFHTENRERLVAIIEVLQNSEVWGSLIHFGPREASFEDISLIHAQKYIDKVKGLESGYLDADTYVSKGSLKAARCAAGAVIEAVQRCMTGEINRAFCAVRPPGHHAESAAAMGFCIFNNIAIGARYAQKIGYKKVFIIDFDVHHGNGTQHAFEEDDTVFFFSTHQYPHYPGTGRGAEKGKGRGEGFTYNVPMQSGSGDMEYLDAYQKTLPPLMNRFAPNLILISAGYDILSDDPLSNIHVSHEGIRLIMKAILQSTSVPVVVSLEGGYHLRALSEAVRITLEELLK